MTSRDTPQPVEAPPPDAMGDRYDRKADWVGGLYSPRNAGWYGPEMTPTQRFTGITMAYMMSAQAVASGREADLADEVIMILAWAPHDKDAIEAGLELAKGDQPELMPLYESMFGEGYFNFPGYEELNLPKISLDQRTAYEYGWEAALMGQHNSEDFYMGDSMRDPQYRPVGVTGGLLRKVENMMAGGAPETTAGDLFKESSVQGDVEGSAMPVLDNLANFGARTAIDLTSAGMAIKGIFGAVAALSGAMKATAAGRPVAQSIANGLDRVQRVAKGGRTARSAVYYGTAAIAAGTTGVQYLSAYMGEPTQQWQDMIGDYQARKRRAEHRGDSTWQDNPTMELFVPMYKASQSPEHQAELSQRQQDAPAQGNEGRTMLGIPFPNAGQQSPEQLQPQPKPQPQPVSGEALGAGPYQGGPV